MRRLLLATLCFILGSSDASIAHAWEERFGYQFTPGQVLVYWFKMEWQDGDRTVGYLGSPYFEVKKINEKKLPELLVVGRLRRWARDKGSETAYFEEGNDIWLGTRIVLEKDGERVGSRSDTDLEKLPYNMKLFIKPSTMILPLLPPTDSTKVGSDVSAKLWETKPPEGFQGIPQLKLTDGRKQDWRESKRRDDGHVSVRREVGFYTTTGPKIAWSYVGNTVFDPQKGYPLRLSATFDHEVAGTKRPTVNITVKLLEGAARDQAIAQGRADWKNVPEKWIPVEFHRQPIDLWLPKHLTDTSAVKQEQVYGHLGDEHRYWKVKVIKVLNQYEVLIRFEGSEEERKVKVATLVHIPPDKASK